MSERPCPNCDSTVTRAIHATTSDMHVNYYRCDTCGHVWTMSKDGTRFVSHITPLSRKDRKSE